MAARGYWQAYQSVKESLGKNLRGDNPGTVVGDDHSKWYAELLGPSVAAGIISAVDLAGYRSGPVYIRRSMHVPPPREAVRDCMPVLFNLLKEEPEPAVRVVLGHFIFVYIHPYVDGNGRMGRFLMNTMLASGGYPWTGTWRSQQSGKELCRRSKAPRIYLYGNVGPNLFSGLLREK